VWARDIWHLESRLLRKLLSHIVAFVLNQLLGNRLCNWLDSSIEEPAHQVSQQ
jgi:hypothetical protein